jgi:hypothetical protein
MRAYRCALHWRGRVFENGYVAVYRDYQLAELRGTDATGRQFAARRCGEMVYPDEAIAAALTASATDPASKVADAARAALTQRRRLGYDDHADRRRTYCD